MINSTTDENTIGEFGYLNGGERVLVTGVRNRHIISEEFFETRMNIDQRR
jgi:hypothetical protein